MQNSWPARIGIIFGLLLSLFGLTISAVLLQHHVVIEVGGNPIFGGICQAMARFNCDDVLASKWSRLAGLPNALWGFFFFSAMATWYLVIGRSNTQRRWPHGIVLWVTILATIFCAVLAVIMYGTMDRWCPFCAASHVTTLLLCLLTALLYPRRKTALPPPIRTEMPTDQPITTTANNVPHPSWRLLLSVLLLATVASAAGWSEYQRRRESAYAGEYRKRWQSYEKDLASVYQKFMEQPVFDIPLTADDPVRGSKDAKHTLIVYSDFQCPWCKTLAQIMEKKVREYPGRLRVAFRHWPMDKTCNDQVTQTLHQGACAAAVVAEAARILGGPDAFWEMHDALFDEQANFRRSSQSFVRAHAEAMGINPDEFMKKASGSSSTWDRVRENLSQAKLLDVKGTPAVFLDGRKFDRYADDHFWKYLFWLEDQASLPIGFRNQIPATRPVASLPSRPASNPASNPGTP